MNKQNAKFFCENCGAEVPQNARMCKHCGRFFSSVRCPVCGTQGPSSKFSNGCPSCGYAISNGNKVPAPKNKEVMATNKSKKDLLNQISAREDAFSSRRQKHADESLPIWIFGVLLIGLLGFIFFAVSNLH